MGEAPSPGGGWRPQAVQRRFTHREIFKGGETMDQNDQNGPGTETKEQQELPTCHTITDLFRPEEPKDGESPLMFGSWQVVGKF